MLFINRKITSLIEELMNNAPVVILQGPDKSGKSSLLQKMYQAKPFVSLEELDQQRMAVSQPEKFLAQFPNGVIIHEFYRVPKLLNYIAQIITKEERKGLYVLTNSYEVPIKVLDKYLMNNYVIANIWPLSLDELCVDKIFFSQIDHYITHGMHPGSFSDNSTYKYYQDYAKNFIERGVRNMISIKDAGLFQDFLILCASKIGQNFNSNSLSNELGVSHHTIQSWLSVLEKAFICFRVKPYNESFGKRTTKAPKIYFTDTGFAAYLLGISDSHKLAISPLRTKLAINFVAIEFYKNFLNLGLTPNMYYFRDSNGNEVNLILEDENKNLCAIDIKPQKTYNSNFIKKLEYFKKLSKDRFKKGYIIYDGNQEQNVENGYNLMNFHSVHKILEESLRTKDKL